MKIVYVLAVLMFIVSVQACKDLTKEQATRAETYHKECMAETGADVDLVNKLHGGEFSNDAKLKCYAKCFLEKAGMFKVGKFQTTILIEELVKGGGDKDAVTKGVLECDSKKGVDACDSFYVSWKCGEEKKIFSFLACLLI